MVLFKTTKIVSFFTFGFQRNVVHMRFKILAIISAIYFVSFIIYSAKFLHKHETLTTNWTENQHSLQFNSTGDIFILLQNEIRSRQVKTSVWFHDEVVKITSLLVSEHKKHLRTIAKLNETVQLRESQLEHEKQKTNEVTKILKAEKDILIANATLYKVAFDYMSYAVSRLEMPYHGVENYTRYASARLGMLPLGDIQQLKPEYGPVINDVLSFRYRNEIPPCVQVNTNRSIFIAVISAPGNFEKRNSIRQTWRQNLNSNYNGLMGLAGFGFSLGMTENKLTQTKVDEENKMYGDIIQSDMIDSYKNLTFKLVGLFNWMVKNCANVDFVFKVDDDIYVNVRSLVHLVQTLNPSNQAMFGTAPNTFDPIRVSGRKTKISREEWIWNKYPPYLTGAGILMTRVAIRSVFAAFQTIPLMAFEDVYLSGMCSEKAGIKLYYSSNTFSVFHWIPPFECGIRRVVAWICGDKHFLSHKAVENFYNNKNNTCTKMTSNGKKIVPPNVPVQISLDIQPPVN